jgi:nicotinate phosphoribosyltransferase
MSLQDTYKPSLALLTDFYQLTMAQGYWKAGMADDEAAFHLSFRKNPFGGGYTLACGLSQAIDYISSFKFDSSDIDFLLSRSGYGGRRLFDMEFLDYLRGLELKLDIDAVPEGTVVFPHEPLVRVSGPLIACQLVETPLLNAINFQTLIATKAARVCQAAENDQVLEFGLRRAQGIDGSLSASRAAFIGGCFATSNTLAGKMYGIPVRGTHAHSWVMSFPDERQAFEGYAKAMPNNCTFLVDTYDTLEGVRHAIEVGKKLRDEEGEELGGIRLDSGDLAYLSIEARKMLDNGGFPAAKIVASNDLDEYLIASLKRQGARIDIWGVGTKLITAYDQPALGGVYKLSALKPKGEVMWRYKIKLSEQTAKTSIPGILQVKRFRDKTGYVADAIYDTLTDGSRTMDNRIVMVVDPTDPNKRKFVDGSKCKNEDLLVPVFRNGKQVYDSPPIRDIRDFASRQLSGFHPGVMRLENPHSYPAGLEMGLGRRRRKMITEAKGQVGFMMEGMETP